MNTLYNYLKAYDIIKTYDSGKEISRPIGLLYTHTGIILGRNKYTGHIMVFHNHTSGPAIVTLEEFSAGYQSQFTNRAMDDTDSVLYRSFQQLQKGNGYDLVANNCHHASSYSRTGTSSSHGLQNTIGVVAFGLFFAWLNSDDDNSKSKRK